MELLLFILISAGVIALPGPNVLIVISTSLSSGKLRGLQTVLGTTSGMAIQLAVAAVGTTWFLSLLKDDFHWIKWVGLAYLVFLIIKQIRHHRREKPPTVSAIGSFHRGFWVSLSNPKTILFFAAYLPQFVSPKEPYWQQMLLYSCIILVLAIIRDCSYALLAHQVVRFIRNRKVGDYDDVLADELENYERSTANPPASSRSSK